MFVTCWGNISRDSSWLVSVFLSPHMFTLYGWYVPAQPSWWHQRSPASLAYTNKYCCISLGVICRNETTVQDQYIQIVEITGVCPLSLPLCTTNYTLQAPSSEGSVVGWPSSSSGSSREAWGEGISESSNEKWFTNFCCQNVVIYIGASFFCQSLSLMPGKDCGKCSTLIFRLVKRGGVRGVALHTNQLYIRVITLGVGRSCSKLELKNAIMETLNTLKHEHCRL